MVDIQAFLQKKRFTNQKIGFVPTMGALHQGHTRLVEESNASTEITVCSIFVNPTQFNDKKDLEKYPRTVEKDIISLIKAGCNVLFLPDAAEIYPEPVTKKYDLGRLETVFEGSSRPGHFQGVCQVVERLFDIVQPDEVFFGQKDYQQCMVINRLLDINPAFKNITMNIVPTIREASGLAMSSRNMRLSREERQTAETIYQVLNLLKEKLKPGTLQSLLTEAQQKLTGEGFKPDYVSIANANTLEPVTNWDGNTPLVALIAAFLGDVRLIDNMVLTN